MTKAVVFLLRVHTGGLFVTLMCPQRALVHRATLALGLADCPRARRGQPHPTGDAAVRVPHRLVSTRGAQLTMIAFCPAVASITHNCKKDKEYIYEINKQCSVHFFQLHGFRKMEPIL